MRHFLTLLAGAVALALLGAAPALALPTITSSEVTGSPLSEEGLTIAVTAKDPDAAVNAVRVAFGDGEGGFGESACRVGRDGKPQGSRSARFEVPFHPTLSGTHTISVTIVSGACGDRERTTSTTIPLDVSVPGLPAVPDPGLPPLLPLPPLPSLPPLARSAAACADTDLIPTATNLKQVRAATLCLINGERSSRGLATLRTNRFLKRAATRHSKDMIGRHYFDHEGPHGPALVSRLRKVHYWPATASENLGASEGVMATPAIMVDAWMHSSAHRANILYPGFRQAGLGILVGTPQGSEGATYTADFGRR